MGTTTSPMGGSCSVSWYTCAANNGSMRVDQYQMFANLSKYDDKYRAPFEVSAQMGFCL